MELGKNLADAVKEVGGIAYQYSFGDVRKQGFRGKSPIFMIFGEKKFSLDGNWRKILIWTCEVLNEMDHDRLIKAVEGFTPSCFAMSDKGMRAPYYHAVSGVWIEKSLSATDIVYYSRKLCLAFNVPLDQIGVVYSEKVSDDGYRKNAGYDESQVVVFENDIRKRYSAGFDFSVSSKRLVEERTGAEWTAGIEHCLQTRMFMRKDGLWFFPDQICTGEVRKTIAARCVEWLEKYPLVVLSCLGDMVSGRCENLQDSFDHGKFAEFCVRHSAKGKTYGFNGKRGNRICYKETEGEELAKARMAEAIKSLLTERMDAVSVSEIADLYPSISRDWILNTVPESLRDAVVVDLGDKAYALKLIEHFYLPDDFAAGLEETIADLELGGELVSVARIIESLNQRYNVSFLHDYMMDEAVFKQVVSKVDPSHRSWTGDVLGNHGGDDKFTFRAVVEKQFDGIFSHDEFYEFGKVAWGWGEEHRAWHHKQLWKSFMRYDDNHWSSIDYFKRAARWESISAQVVKVLSELLGSRPFMPLAHVTQHILDSLPTLVLDGVPTEWTKELLVSVAYHCLPEITTLNHAKLPYGITTLLVPQGVKDKSDGIDYMLGIYKERNWHNATINGAFVFLKENNVRVNFVESLKNDITRYLGGEIA